MPKKSKTMTPEDIGAALGRLANRIDEWKKQREALLAEGERLVAVAMSYVQELRGEVGPAPARRRGGRPKGMKLSEETRAKLRAAWKRRKARMAAAKTAAGKAAKTVGKGKKAG
ncbi:MAG: hypothetical protein DIU54_011685 [Acidobacteriota bacterium]|nr:MAG: hypothetical protein DIU54_14590 [Acidobacteriota bacterium]